MIDIHSHILPGIDDGPPTLEESLALARACVADGIRHVVATPHVFPGRYDNRRGGIEAEAARFRKALEVFRIPLALSVAGEVRLMPEVVELLARDEIPFLCERDGYRLMLLELPDHQIPLGAEAFVGRLLAARVRPVIVHPERNKAVMAKPERVRGFVDLGCEVQVTAGSVIGLFGERVAQAAHALIGEGWVSAIANDAHNLRGRRPCMSPAREALAARYGERLATRLTLEGPARLAGVELPPPSAHG